MWVRANLKQWRERLFLNRRKQTGLALSAEGLA